MSLFEKSNIQERISPLLHFLFILKVPHCGPNDAKNLSSNVSTPVHTKLRYERHSVLDRRDWLHLAMDFHGAMRVGP